MVFAHGAVLADDLARLVDEASLNIRRGRKILSKQSFQSLSATNSNALSSEAAEYPIKSRPAIHALPPEILGRIFFLVIDRSFALSTPVWPFRLRRTSQVIPLTHVCRDWRDLALNMALLWTSLHLTRNANGQDNQLAYLKRSKCAPLRVVVHDWPCQVVEDHLSKWSDRVQELYLCSSILISDLHFPVPALEVLELGAALLPHDTLIGRPLILFRGYTPRLRRFTLKFPVTRRSWIPGNQFKCLTHLCIHGSLIEQKLIGDLMMLLSHTSGLQEFLLVSPTSPLGLSVIHDPAWPAVVLTSLRRLALYIPGEITVVILSHIDIPRDAVVCCQRASKFSVPDPLLSTLAASLPVGACTRVKVEDSTLTRSAFDFVASGPSSALWMYSGGTFPLGPSLLPLCGMWPSVQIQELWISTADLNPPQCLREIVDALPGLTTLALYGGHIAEWMLALTSSPIPCPNLTTLYARFAGTVVPPQLLEMATIRAQQGFPLNQLVAILPNLIPRCDLSAGLWEELGMRIASIEARGWRDRPSMPLPDVCTVDPPEVHWPKW